MDALEHANELMEVDKHQEAEAILDRVLSGQLSDDDYEGAIAVYLAGYEYDKALALFQRYREQTGKDPDRLSDWKQADIAAEKLVYRQTSYNTRSSSAYRTVMLYPVSPVNIFLLLFIGIGGFFLREIFSGGLHGLYIELLGVAMGLFMLWGGVKGLLTCVKSDEVGLDVLAVKYRPSGWKLKAPGFFTLPPYQKIPYRQISAATVKLYNINRGQGAALKLRLKDGTVEILGLSPPFLVKNCEELVLNLRAKGVQVFVQPGALRRSFV